MKLFFVFIGSYQKLVYGTIDGAVALLDIYIDYWGAGYMIVWFLSLLHGKQYFIWKLSRIWMIFNVWSKHNVKTKQLNTTKENYDGSAYNSFFLFTYSTYSSGVYWLWDALKIYSYKLERDHTCFSMLPFLMKRIRWA